MTKFFKGEVMSYRCADCRSVVPHGTPMFKRVERRPDRSVLREVPVCEACLAGPRRPKKAAAGPVMFGAAASLFQFPPAGYTTTV